MTAKLYINCPLTFMTFILNAFIFKIWEWCSWKLENSLVVWESIF